MKKLFITIGASLLFLFGTSVTCLILKTVDFARAWQPLVIGCILIVVSLIILVIYKKTHFSVDLYFIYLVNMISMGFLVNSWHIFREYDLEFYVLMLISLACVLYLILYTTV